jgi:hypothetical protein
MPMKLTVADLKSLKALLRYARELIDDAANTSRAADDTARHIRLRSLSRQVDDELDSLSRSLAAAERAAKS